MLYLGKYHAIPVRMAVPVKLMSNSMCFRLHRLLLSPVFLEPAKGKNVNSFAGKLVFNIPHTLVIALGKNIWNI